MKKKSVLYKKQQEELANRIISILNLDKEHSINLYDIDNDQEKINNIISLASEIKIYFSVSTIAGINAPDNIKRPWLSIVRQVTKKYFTMHSKNFRIERGEEFIMTKKYTFVKNVD